MTPTIKKYYRHFNAFLQTNGVKQIFWKHVQLEANRHNELYNITKTKLLHGYCPRHWIMYAFNWTQTELRIIFWAELNNLWEIYYKNIH